MSTSKDELKIWNVTTCNPIRTIASGYGLCGIFAPGDRHVVIGTKTGAVEALLSLSFLISMNSVLFFDFSGFIMKISSFEVKSRGIGSKTEAQRRKRKRGKPVKNEMGFRNA